MNKQLIYIAIGACTLLTGCGLRFRTTADYAPQLRSTKVINLSDNSQLGKQLAMQLKALNMLSTTNNSTITITSYSFKAQPPAISDDNQPLYDINSATACFKVTNTRNNRKALHLCVDEQLSQIVDTASAFNPSMSQQAKRLLNGALTQKILIRLQQRDVWQYFE